MPFSHLRRLFAVSLFAAAPALFAQAPLGVHPRPAPTDYAVSQQGQSATFAASLVPQSEVNKMFAFDIGKTYLVIEVACYPNSSSGAVTVAPDDFLIKSGPKNDFIHPVDAVTVASVIQDKNTPRPAMDKPVSVVTTAGVGYESGTDPYTGRRIHGTYTDVGTAVTVGNPYPPGAAPPRAGSTDYDRMTLEQQLEQRAFPSGNFSAPTAGFLYFPLTEAKKKTGVYELEYLSNGAGAVLLPVPVKSR